MARYAADDLKNLIRSDRVHRDLYLDPEIFELEIERVFGRTWIFVGHESLVPNPGDFYCIDVARQPVVMVRHTDRKVYVIYNRCGHRGTRVVNQESGNVKWFSCMYHGWTYETNGELAGVPLREDEDEDGFDFTDPHFSMMQLPRVDSYHGFVFASLSPEGPDLLAHIGTAKVGFDEIVDRAPDGEVEMAAGCHRYEYRGNWKLQIDNLSDSYHPPASHSSTVGPDGNQFARRPGKAGQQVRFYDEHGTSLVPLLGVNAYPYGHVSCESMFTDDQAGAGWSEYWAILAKKYGPERAREVLRHKFHSITLYPTFDLLTAQNSIRLILPKAVDHTEVRIYPLRLKGAPDEVFYEDVQYVGLTHSPTSFVQTDDMESFLRVQQGLRAQGSEWVIIARGLKREKWDNKGLGAGVNSSELGTRHQYRRWLDLVSGKGPSYQRAERAA